MKATELMIGDWVGRVFDDKRIIEDCRQVNWIRTGEIGMRYQKVWSIGCIEPIPLTPEILEKNGYIRKPLMKKWVVDGELELIEDRMGDMELEYWFSVSDQYVCPIHYVHELQHALRLCGLHDLADNFKI